jgi:hypothetical protein
MEKVLEEVYEDSDIQPFSKTVMLHSVVVSLITNDARYTRKIKSMIVMAKAAFNKKTLLTSKLDLNLNKKLLKCYIWSIALYGAENLTFRKVKN